MVAVREDVAESAEPGAWRRRVDGVLPRSAGAGRLPGYLAASVGAVGFQLFTPAGLTHLNHVWAEDGARFLVDALREPLAANLVAPYGGYLHTVPRLVAELVSVLPLSWAAVAIAIAVALLRTGVALLVFAASGGYLRAVPVRIGLAALVIVLPAGNSETLGNLANLHWFLLYGAFWAVLWRPASLGLNVLAAAVVLLAGLSSPLVFLLAPLALLRLALPAWRERLSALAFGVALVGQVVAVLLGTRAPYSNDAVDPVQVLLASLLRGPVVAFTGSEQVARVYPRFGNWPVLAAVVLALVPIALAVVRGDGTRRFPGVARRRLRRADHRDRAGRQLECGVAGAAAGCGAGRAALQRRAVPVPAHRGGGWTGSGPPAPRHGGDEPRDCGRGPVGEHRSAYMDGCRPAERRSVGDQRHRGQAAVHEWGAGSQARP
ncbi:MAG TPA: hypothetical protein VGR06_36010 [Actinophytocola sp.]|jgi:hypothetical protein|uniref:hypothetical protein n=1 Tax=Actinophytocola sp. TaxID=1872138 RepID=UPI002E0CC3B3|nr:hypothetical protein [Actinophytocola sp.]